MTIYEKLWAIPEICFYPISAYYLATKTRYILSGALAASVVMSLLLARGMR